MKGLPFIVPLGCLWFSVNCMAQQTIANPLVRPASMNSAPTAPAAALKTDPAANPAGAGQATASPDLRDKAASRLNQEDFNLKQQSLNASSIPTPLTALFNQMAVSAYVGGVVVLRRAEYVTPSLVSGAAAPSVTPSSSGGQGTGQSGGASRSSAGGAAVSVVSSSVLRLKLGQTTNLNGYALRARLDGVDVSVEWRNEQNEWVTVFFGAIESAPNTSVATNRDNLEKMDTSQFNYLKPQVSSRTTTNGTNSNQQNNGASSGFNNTGNSTQSGTNTSSF